MWNIFTSSTEYFEFNRVGFIRRVKDITKTFHDISVDQIRVRYLDNENCYVNLEEALMGDLKQTSLISMQNTNRLYLVSNKYFSKYSDVENKDKTIESCWVKIAIPTVLKLATRCRTNLTIQISRMDGIVQIQHNKMFFSRLTLTQMGN